MNEDISDFRLKISDFITGLSSNLKSEILNLK